MRLNKQDCKKIYISYYIGIDNDEKPVYTEPIKVFAQVGSINSYMLNENIGKFPGYDRIIQLEKDDNIEFLREDSLIWVDTVPNSTKNNMDYKIEKLGESYDNIIPLYCSSTIPNTKALYYSIDATNIYQVKVIYKDLTAIVPKNMYFPIDEDSAVWFIKPSNILSTNGKIHLINKEQCGDVYKLTFEAFDD